MEVKRKITILKPTDYGKNNHFKHLYIILNDPCLDLITGHKDMVLSVNCSSIKENQFYDEACILEKGCHEFITKDSFIFYKHTRIDPAIIIQTGIEANQFITKEIIDDNLYRNIIKGLFESKFTERKYKAFLKQAMKQNACLDIFSKVS